MFKKLLLTVCIVLTSSVLALAQQGRLKGQVVDDSGEPVSFANIVLEVGGTMVGGATSDFDGYYDINPIPPGTYELKATFVGYNAFVMRGVVIAANKITFQNIKMTSGAIDLDDVEVIDYKVPLISKDQTQTGASVTAEEIAKLPSRSAEAVAATVGGVYSEDGGTPNMRGARSDGTAYYIDGVRVSSSSVPQSAIDQIDVILGGTPAMYGDATGGIINMTTKGPSRTFASGIELETSELLDGFGYNRVGLNIQGPLIKGKDQNGTALLGFFLAGEAEYNRDNVLSPLGVYTATDEWLQYIEENPLRVSGSGSGTYQNGEYTRVWSEGVEHNKENLDSDLKWLKNATSLNNGSYSVNLLGNINVRTSSTTNLTFGGSFAKSFQHVYSRSNSYFNYDKNYSYAYQSWRTYGRFTQRFPSDAESTSLIKNFYYTIQADYTRSFASQYDDDYDNIWQYGYLGKYQIYKTPSFQLGSDTINGHLYENVWVLNSWDYDTLVRFTSGTINGQEINPLLSNYTENYYNLYNGVDPFGYYDNFTDLQLGGALLNSGSPSSFYGHFAAPGSVQTNFSKSESSQFGLQANAAMTVGNHEIKLGFQYEQRNSRSYSVSGYSMWYLMRSLLNSHILQLDTQNPYVSSYDGFVDTIWYGRLNDASSQKTFDMNFRKRLVDGAGNQLDPDGNKTWYVNIDSYDFEDNSVEYYDEQGNLKTAYLQGGFTGLDDLSMFTVDELQQDGNMYVSYYGYDYLGNKYKERTNYKSYSLDTLSDGSHSRYIGSFQPIYMAGYIQDKFAFRDLIFNIGVRVDRFDANQEVLKDPYSLYDTYTLDELISEGKLTATDGGYIIEGGTDVVEIPESMIREKENIVVYVNKLDDISEILGYRNGSTWYNQEGIEMSEVTSLDAGSGISPWLKNINQQRVEYTSFKDYTPQYSVMPRISFSFPISDDALFFAHYDILTQRPSEGLYVSPATYYYFSEISGTIGNPSLKPSQTIEYELGFTQKISNSSSMTISAYYRELRNMIQMYRYTGAYPKDYSSYSNLDFGTVKGLTVEYDLRRTKNARVRASYGLAFANATGASSTTAAALIAAGVPNLRSTFPMPWDRRHQFNLVLDYRYGQGKEYNGPVRERKDGTVSQVLKNTGFSLTVGGGSGTPYTAARNVQSPLSSTASLLKGTYYGSRLPASFRLDLKIDRDIDLVLGKGEDKRGAYMNVYLQILNLLNTRNITSVYSATGNPDDDGYLSDPQYQREIQNQVDAISWAQLYETWVNSPYNYSTPRRIRVGVIFNF